MEFELHISPSVPAALRERVTVVHAEMINWQRMRQFPENFVFLPTASQSLRERIQQAQQTLRLLQSPLPLHATPRWSLEDAREACLHALDGGVRMLAVAA
jgi:hypothetical protein